MTSVFKRRDPSQLQSKLEALTGNNHESDPNEWRLTVDKASNGSALIRFLPAKDDNSAPFVKIYNHGFKNANGKWFIDNCPTTIGEQCPVCDSNSALWSTNIKENQNIVKGRKRKLSYWANILVVNDPANPDNNGKVFKFRFGAKIMEKINQMASPDESLGEQPIDVTCVYEGCNFKLKSCKKDNFVNYDSSAFNNPSAIDNIDDADTANKLANSMHDLTKIIDKSQFKPYNILKDEFDKVVNGAGSIPQTASNIAEGNFTAFDAEMEQFKNQSQSNNQQLPYNNQDENIDDILKGL